MSLPGPRRSRTETPPTSLDEHLLPDDSPIHADWGRLPPLSRPLSGVHGFQRRPTGRYDEAPGYDLANDEGLVHDVTATGKYSHGRILMVRAWRTTGEQVPRLLEMTDFSPAQPRCAKTRRSAGKAASEEPRRDRPYFVWVVRSYEWISANGETHVATPIPENIFRYVEGLNDARTLLEHFQSPTKWLSCRERADRQGQQFSLSFHGYNKGA